jgi:molybdenum-dependent DNA-binding transcriptional regulator ModE
MEQAIGYWWSLEETARRLGLSYMRVWQLATEDRLVSRKRGGRWQVNAAAAESFREQRQRRAEVK